MTWLLDTNTLVYILNGEARIRARANEAGRAGRVVTSIVVVAELLYRVERLLGVGLHSYGFMDKAFWWLSGFIATQLLLTGICLLPRHFCTSPKRA